MTKEIKLYNSQDIVLIDNEDYNWVSKHKWHARSKKLKYASTNIKINNKYSNKFMHRLIMNEPKNMHIDHIDHNSLNNQKDNLRIVTRSQNMMNRNKKKNSLSKYKGVSWHKGAKKWISNIGLNKKLHHLGYFTNEIDAAKAYNKVAKEIYGEYAYLNEV